MLSDLFEPRGGESERGWTNPKSTACCKEEWERERGAEKVSAAEVMDLVQ